MTVRCPTCGSRVKPVTIGNPMDGGTTINAVIRCTRQFCRREYSLHVFLMAMGVYNDDGVAHGTAAALKEHRERHESLCDECRDFNTRRFQDRQKSKKELVHA